jgi:hypothetical protein
VFNTNQISSVLDGNKKISEKIDRRSDGVQNGVDWNKNVQNC